MKTIKIKVYIRGSLEDVTICTDKIIGVKVDNNSPPYNTRSILFTSIGQFCCNESVRDIEHKIKWC